ncbi:Ribosomal RNA large subunit methyltransferase E [Rickettsiales endosymbiont of Paramecium tredecaurelia]|uniref:RlmE family RNA methyltransferase n=1 Tax=Candidatus Sarmatiella mevalonica TaxID=2770581 RepID=UPI0019226DC0|nr:RlmE family RNA methyltransferase [Candidatus Sarmatiella mevalonica]MBL3285047.1 Ribosomal RNA large subunit methyltransferase E [Candidatus Sarmatiella mevalonica]
MSKNSKVQNKRLKASSKRWMQRHLQDPYVARAKSDDYRSRAAYKLIEINEKFKFFKHGQTVVDLGAAPGGWSQVAACATGGRVIAMDLLEMQPIDGVEFILGDFLFNALSLPPHCVDVVMSDMAPNTTGHKQTDHIRIMALCQAVLDFAIIALKPGGVMICKFFQGGAQNELRNALNCSFKKVSYFKPNASRKESSESYLVAIGKY